MSKFNIAYFINQYPKVSHSFIRREILALERQGFSVERIALRGWDGDLVDVEDLRERGCRMASAACCSACCASRWRVRFALPTRWRPRCA